MSNSIRRGPFDIVRRFDQSIAIYLQRYWPDDYLDSNPAADRRYRTGTRGWRAYGWQVVHVTTSLPAALAWCDARLAKDA